MANAFGKVLTPASDKAARKLAGIVENNAPRGTRGLTRTDRRLLAQGGETYYIYNVSPIWSWSRPIQNKGNVFIPKRGKDEKVSMAAEVPPFLVRDFDKGNGTRQQMLEEGIAITEDILGCSTEYPGLAANNLLNYGCFYTTTPFEELPEEKQQALLDEANQKHHVMCQEKILEADQLHSANHTAWITEMYRLCALFEKEDRPWVAKRGKQNPTEECRFCGWENKRGIAKCANCKEIVNQELYDELKKGNKKA